jgi:hypothetical protein
MRSAPIVPMLGQPAALVWQLLSEDGRSGGTRQSKRRRKLAIETPIANLPALRRSLRPC